MSMGGAEGRNPQGIRTHGAPGGKTGKNQTS